MDTCFPQSIQGKEVKINASARICSVDCVFEMSRLSESWYFNRKSKRPVHDLTSSICNMFAMCTSCREKRE